MPCHIEYENFEIQGFFWYLKTQVFNTKLYSPATERSRKSLRTQPMHMQQLISDKYNMRYEMYL